MSEFMVSVNSDRKGFVGMSRDCSANRFGSAGRTSVSRRNMGSTLQFETCTIFVMDAI